MSFFYDEIVILFLQVRGEKLLVFSFIGIEYGTMSYFNDPKETRCKYI